MDALHAEAYGRLQHFVVDQHCYREPAHMLPDALAALISLPSCLPLSPSLELVGVHQILMGSPPFPAAIVAFLKLAACAAHTESVVRACCSTCIFPIGIAVTGCESVLRRMIW